MIKVPYVYVRDNLDYSFKFNKKTHYVPQANHQLKSKSEIIQYGKQHAEKVFFKHYRNEGVLPSINLTKNGNGYEWSYFLNERCYQGFSANDRNQVFSEAINHLLKTLKVGGVS